jgi:hypothetical protein
MRGRHTPEQARRVDLVEPGYFKLRLVKNGWQVPAQIAREGRDWFAVLDGTALGMHRDPFQAEQVARIHEYGTRITLCEYVRLLAQKEWSRDHAPDHPCLFPMRPVTPGTLPLLRIPGRTP